MAVKQLEEIQKKLTMLNYPRSYAPAQSLLFAGMERYALLEWLFFRFDSDFTFIVLLTIGNPGVASYFLIELWYWKLFLGS